MRKIGTLLALVCLLITLCLTASAEEGTSLKPGDYTPEEIREEIRSVYTEALSRADLHSFSGYCGTMVGYQTYLMGIDTELTPTNGCDAYEKYCKQSITSGGYGVTAYSARNYSIREAMAAVSAEGPAYDMLLCFQKGSNTPDGLKYGHCVFINAVIDGTVFFCESYPFWVGNKRIPEGNVVECPMDEFCRVYETRFREFEGLIDFSSPGLLPAAGQCGDNLNWYYGEGVLSISGEGSMWDGAPWTILHRYVKEIVLEEGITNVGANAFRGFSRITQVELPQSVTALGDGSFSRCARLSTINLEEGLRYIGFGAFDESPALRPVVSEGHPNFRAAGDGSLLCVEGGKLLSCVACQGDTFTIPQGITTVCTGAFTGARMKTIVLGPDVAEVEAGAFLNAVQLKTLKLASGNTSFRVSNGALCSADGKHLYAVVTGFAWFGIPSGVETLADYAFATCRKLQEVQIPTSVREIAPQTFSGCSSLMRVSLDRSNPNLTERSGVIYSKDGLTLITAPCFREEEYEVAQGVVEICPNAFGYCENLRRVTVNADVQLIGEGALGYTASGKTEGFTIVGDVDSPAYYYSSVNGFTFESLQQ